VCWRLSRTSSDWTAKSSGSDRQLAIALIALTFRCRRA
jgi:hypothetical protein